MGTTCPVLLFADDTLLLANTAEQMTTVLSLTIAHSEPNNLDLNNAKCQLLVTSDTLAEVFFPDHTPVKKTAFHQILGEDLQCRA